ncbi:MAG: pyrroline-5-carboxylate reductase [Planctomycetota bacterium]|nr:MAG: pyrroline-5-carboxylate reductase [Planctomycetota bacterium]
MKAAVIGCGVMGRTLLDGLRRAGGWELAAATRSAETARAVTAELGLPVGTDNAAAVRGAELVVLCLKPKNLLAAAADLAPALAPDCCVVSIAAGVGLAELAGVLPAGQPLIRAMPNTPCRVGAGMTALAAGPRATAEQVAAGRRLFESVGRVAVLAEEHLDAVTGLSASGVAFLYLALEALVDGGVMAGLPRDKALELATQTMLGAARMVQETGRHPAALKDEVTTPAGCTISALLRLEDGRLRSVLARGVEEAARAAANLGRKISPPGSGSR